MEITIHTNPNILHGKTDSGQSIHLQGISSPRIKIGGKGVVPAHKHQMTDIDGLPAELDAIRELIKPAEKEVINATPIESTESVTDPVDNAYYIILPTETTNGTLYLYTTEDGFVEQTPNESVAYIVAGDGSTSIYLWNGSKFVDVTGQQVDGTIYVNNLTTDLSSYIETATYRICHSYIKQGVAPTREIDFYTLDVAKVSQWTRRQILVSNDGYKVRYYNPYEDIWTEWEDHTYAYVDHKHTTDDVKLASDETVTLTVILSFIEQEIEKNRKLAKAGIVL